MTLGRAQERISDEIEAEHDAFMVDLLGPHAVPPERYQWLMERGYIVRPLGWSPLGLAQEIGRGSVSEDLDESREARARPLRDWKETVKSWETRGHGVAAPPVTPFSGEPATSLPIPAPPSHLSNMERDAWIQATTRAADYARGLGNALSERMQTVLAEEWDEAEAAIVPDPDRREELRALIREKVAEALEARDSPERLASRLLDATGDAARDWLRIARTELQGAMNDAAIIRAVRLDGPGGRVARIPNANACRHCRRLFLDESGRPHVFTIEELLENGTNVGKRSDDWKATAWGIHPNCSCSVQRVPEGMDFDDDWRLVRAE